MKYCVTCNSTLISDGGTEFECSFGGNDFCGECLALIPIDRFGRLKGFKRGLVDRWPGGAPSRFRCNPDEEYRQLERLASTGDVSASNRLLQKRIQLGEVTRNQLYVAALLGDKPARHYFLAQPSEDLTAIHHNPAPQTGPQLTVVYKYLSPSSSEQETIFLKALLAIAKEMREIISQDARELQDSMRGEGYLARTGYQVTLDHLHVMLEAFGNMIYRIDNLNKDYLTTYLELPTENVQYLAMTHCHTLMLSSWQAVNLGYRSFQAKSFQKLQQKAIRAVFD